MKSVLRIIGLCGVLSFAAWVVLPKKAKITPHQDPQLLVDTAIKIPKAIAVEEPDRIKILRLTQFRSQSTALTIQDPNSDLPDLDNSEVNPKRIRPWGATGTDAIWRGQIQRANATLKDAGLSGRFR
jgi:hypothetical protein